MAGSKPAALPLGDAPTAFKKTLWRIERASTGFVRQPIQQRRAVHAAHYITGPTRGHARRRALCRSLIGHGDKHAGTSAGQPRFPKFTQPIKRFGDLATTLADYRGAVVTTTPRKKVAYCRDGGITCQFRILKDGCSTHSGGR